MTKTLIEDLKTGLFCHCPKCNEGKMFKSYLKVADECPNCGEELYHHRADDLPAYFSILIVGHFVVLAATAVELAYAPDYWIHILLWGPLTIITTLLILQPIKGAAVALQWRMGMHGFRKSKELREQK